MAPSALQAKALMPSRDALLRIPIERLVRGSDTGFNPAREPRDWSVPVNLAARQEGRPSAAATAGIPHPAGTGPGSTLPPV